MSPTPKEQRLFKDSNDVYKLIVVISVFLALLMSISAKIFMQKNESVDNVLMTVGPLAGMIIGHYFNRGKEVYSEK